MKTTKEEREWLRLNWSVGEPSFRRWLAGSDRAHELVPCALQDVDDLVKVLGKILDNEKRLEGQVAIHNTLQAKRDALAEARQLLQDPDPEAGNFVGAWHQ